MSSNLRQRAAKAALKALQEGRSVAAWSIEATLLLPNSRDGLGREAAEWTMAVLDQLGPAALRTWLEVEKVGGPAC